MTPDLYDISRHQRRVDWQAVPLIPGVHKVNEGRSIDPYAVGRLPRLAERTEIFGGYTNLIVASSSIREQLDVYADVIGPHWRPGAFTQLNVEPWPSRPWYHRPPNIDELAEAQAYHDELFGPGRWIVYLNPNQLPNTYALWRRAFPDAPHWIPDYSSDGAEQAARRGAVIHQYTSTGRLAGIPGNVDLNHVRDPDRLRNIAGLPEPPTPGDPDMPTLRFAKVPGDTALFVTDGIGAKHVGSGAEYGRRLADGRHANTAAADSVDELVPADFVLYGPGPFYPDDDPTPTENRTRAEHFRAQIG